MSVDVAVVGNGAVGAAIALRLLDVSPSTRVAIVGRRERAGSATTAAGAMLNVFAEVHRGDPDGPAARAKLRIAVDAAARWPDHLRLLRDHAAPDEVPEIIPGTYVVEASPAGADRFDSIVAEVTRNEAPFRLLGGGDPVRGVDVEIARRWPRKLLLIDEGRLDARLVMAAYDRAFERAANAVVIHEDAQAIQHGALSTLLLSNGTRLRARAVVIAAGVRSQVFIDQLGLSERVPRVVAGAGSALLMDVPEGVAPLDHVLRCAGTRPEVGFDFYALPAGGAIYVGATTYGQVTPTPIRTSDDVERLRAAAATYLHPRYRSAQIREVLFGFRPITLDTCPLLGACASREGVWFATGTRRDGFHASPLIGAELARCIAKSLETNSVEQPFDGLFRPERAALLETPREVAIERALHAASKPTSRAHVEQVHRAAGLDGSPFGIPPELFDVYEELFAPRAR